MEAWISSNNYLSTFFLDLALEKYVSKNNPRKTKTAPIHCRAESAFPKSITDPSTVKNLRVVVTRDRGKGPNSDT